MYWTRRIRTGLLAFVLAAGAILLSGLPVIATERSSEESHTITVNRVCTDYVGNIEDRYALISIGVGEDASTDSNSVKTEADMKEADIVSAAAGNEIQIRFMSSTSVNSVFYEFEVDHWEYNGISATEGADGTLNFTMPDGDVDVTCYYKKVGVQVTLGSVDETGNPLPECENTVEGWKENQKRLTASYAIVLKEHKNKST